MSEKRLPTIPITVFCSFLVLICTPLVARAEDGQGERPPGTKEVFSRGTVACDLIMSGVSIDTLSARDCSGDCSSSWVNLGAGVGGFLNRILLLEGIFRWFDWEYVRSINIGTDISILPRLSQRAHLDVGGEVGMLAMLHDHGDDKVGVRFGAHFGVGGLIKDRLSLGVQGYYGRDMVEDATRDKFGLRLRILAFFPR